jgi:CRISPR-associated protein Cas1
VCKDRDRRLDIGKSIIDGKIASSLRVIDWLTSRYPEIKETRGSCFAEIDEYRARTAAVKTTRELVGIEGMVARNYWLIVREVIDPKLEFVGRLMGKTDRPMGAVDPVNALLNYGYSVLETQCRAAINGCGLDPYIGFVHEAAPNKTPLVYDLQEPYRWLVDVAIIDGLERGEFSRKDFILTENYNLRLKAEAARRLVELVSVQLTSRVPYRG